MKLDYKTIKTVADVTEPVLRAAEETLDSWFTDDDAPIDWEEFIDRLADPEGHGPAGPIDFDEYDNPAIRKIQRHIRDYRRQA